MMIVPQPPSAVLKCSWILIFIKSKPHQLISEVQTTAGKISCNWFITCSSLVRFSFYLPGAFHCQTISFLSWLPNFLLSLTSLLSSSPPIPVQPLLFWMQSSQSPLDLILGALLIPVVEFCNFPVTFLLFLNHNAYRINSILLLL